MPTRRSEETTPDLFSARPTGKASEPTAVSESKIKPGAPISPPRFLLPKDLAGALKRLEDVEIDALLAGAQGRTKSWNKVKTRPARRCCGSGTGRGELGDSAKLTHLKAVPKNFSILGV